MGEPLVGHPDHAAAVLLNANATVLVAGSVRHLAIWDVRERRVGRCVVARPPLPREKWEVAIADSGNAVAIARRDESEVTLCVRGAD